jgi:tetratricopeptide (TPR) repeat protein
LIPPGSPGGTVFPEQIGTFVEPNTRRSTMLELWGVKGRREHISWSVTMIDKFEKSVFPSRPVSIGQRPATHTPFQAFQAAVAFHQQGLRDQAEPLYRRALRQDRNHFDSLHNLGLILLEWGSVDEAVSLIRKACYQRPKNPEAQNSLGVALQALKQPARAIEHHRKALAIRPDYPEAHLSLGFALQSLNRSDEAISHYHRALEIRPDYAEAHHNLATALQMRDRTMEAIPHYRRALAVRSDLAEVHHDLGIALQAVGRIEEACRGFEKAIALAPRNARFYRSLVSCKRIAADDPCVAAMEALAEEMATLSEEAQMELHFALGTAFAELGQPERSFPHLLKGNALKRRQIVYDEATVLGHFQRTRTAYTPEIMRDKRGVGDPSTIPVFVFGMPRSGSTLIEQILASHPKIFGAGELDDFEETAADLGIDPEKICLLTRDDLCRIGGSYVGSVKARAPAAARIVDKMPGNFRLAGLIHLALPNARIIHTIRDPIDTCLSCFSKLFSGDQPYTYDLAELGRYYRAYEALMDHWRSVLPKGVMLEVQYEAMVADIEREARRLIAHCGLEWDDACLSFYETERVVRTASAAQARRPIYNSSVGRWHCYGDMIGPLCEVLGVELG